MICNTIRLSSISTAYLTSMYAFTPYCYICYCMLHVGHLIHYINKYKIVQYYCAYCTVVGVYPMWQAEVCIHTYTYNYQFVHMVLLCWTLYKNTDTTVQHDLSWSRHWHLCSYVFSLCSDTNPILFVVYFVSGKKLIILLILFTSACIFYNTTNKYLPNHCLYIYELFCGEFNRICIIHNKVLWWILFVHIFDQ